jgi:chromate transporter
MAAADSSAARAPVGLGEVLVQWGRIGCISFGGSPTHIALLRDLCVDRRRWIDATEFEDALATCNLLPGPASMQLAVLCAWIVAGPVGAVLGGIAFIVPGLVLILTFAVVLTTGTQPTWVLAAVAGTGAAVGAVAIQAGISLIPASWARAPSHVRWLIYTLAGGIAAATVGPLLVFVLLGCGAIELGIGRAGTTDRLAVHVGPFLIIAAVTAASGGVLALSFVALKIGALAYGGGFVIIPLMHHDAVSRYSWMTNSEFLDAVALGQMTPGPIVLTVAFVGYAAAGLAGGLLAAAIAFSPSFLFVLLGARHFHALRGNTAVRAFLDGAGPAAIGAIIGVAIPLAQALAELWQFAVLGGAVLVHVVLRRSAVVTLLLGAAVGIVVVQLGAPVP